MSVKLLPAEMRHYFSRVYNKLAFQVEIKGFRPGAAPKAMVMNAIGENRLGQEIIDTAIQESYPVALRKENLMPVGTPEIKVTMMKDLTADSAELEYEAAIDIFPQIKLGNYKKIRLPAKINKTSQKKEVTENEINQVLEHLARQKAEFKEISRPVKMGDRVELNFEAFDKFVKIESLSSQNYPVILGSKVLIPEFEKEIVGLKKGEKKEFSLTVAPNPNEKPKKIDFKLEVTHTQEVILPKMDDSFAKNFQKDSLAELKKAISEDILKQKEIQAKRMIEAAVLEELVKIIEADLPESLVHQEVDRETDEIRNRVASMGLPFEQYLKNLNKTQEEFEESLRPQAEKTIKIGLSLGEIAKEENLDPKDKEAGKKALEKLIGYATK